MAKTPQRKVRMDDRIWPATLWLAKYLGRDGSVVIRELVGDWIAREAARDPEVAGHPLVRQYLTGGRVDQVDDSQLVGQLVQIERFPPLRRAG